MNSVDIYTDGACSQNPGVGGWGAVLIWRGTNITKEISGYDCDTTNNRMELKAVIMGLDAIKERCKITVYSDSRYICDAVNLGWLNEWEKHDWITSTDNLVANEDLWYQLHGFLHRYNVSFKWVKAHSGNTFNELADRLAVEAIDKFYSKAWRLHHPPKYQSLVVSKSP